MDDLIKRVKASEKTKKSWRNKFDSTEYREASQLNKVLTGLPLNRSKNCECIEDLFFLLKRGNINRKINTMQNQKFKVQKGKVITLHNCTTLTEHSTDEQIISFLKASPAHIEKLERYPANWKEIVYGEDSKPAAKKVEEVKEEPAPAEEKPEAEAPAEDSGNTPEPKEAADFLNNEDLKVYEIKEILDNKGVEYDKKARKAELLELLKANS